MTDTAMGLLREALKSLNRCEDATAYSSHDDSVGYRVCCQVPSYYPHEKGCHIPLVIARITALLDSGKTDAMIRNEALELAAREYEKRADGLADNYDIDCAAAIRKLKV